MGSLQSSGPKLRSNVAAAYRLLALLTLPPSYSSRAADKARIHPDFQAEVSYPVLSTGDSGTAGEKR